MRDGLDPLNRNLKLFPKDSTFLGNYCFDITGLIMNYVSHPRFAYIFFSQITFIGSYDHADLNLFGLFLGPLTGLVSLLRLTIAIRVNLRRLLITHSENPFLPITIPYNWSACRSGLLEQGIETTPDKAWSRLNPYGLGGTFSDVPPNTHPLLSRACRDACNSPGILSDAPRQSYP